MRKKLRIAEASYAAIRRHHCDTSAGKERLSYAFGNLVKGADGDGTIVVTEMPILPSDDCYGAQSGGSVALDRDVHNAILARFARSDYDVIINIHDHGFSRCGTRFSPIDTADDRKFDRYLRKTFEPMLARGNDIGRSRRVINMSLVLDRKGLDARFLDGSGDFQVVDRVDVIGLRPARLVPNGLRLAGSAPADATVMRQKDIVAREQQEFIAETNFGIVGCGGLGSIAAEALARLGARHFVLFDPDVLEAHNLNRWQGGSTREIGSNKAELLATHLKNFFDDGVLDVTAVPFSVLSAEAESHLKSADVIIGCLDSVLPRFFLNRFAVQYAVPLFDAGVVIAAGGKVDFQHRYVSVIPGCTACLECTDYQLLDREELNRELMDPVTAAERKAAGYVQDRPEIAAASAYSLNLQAVGTLVTEFLNWICGFRKFATCSSQRWYDGSFQRSDRDNHPECPDPACFCCSKLLGAADRAKFPRPLSQEKSARIFEEVRNRQRTLRSPSRVVVSKKG